MTIPNRQSPAIIKAIATIFEGQHDWLLHIKEEDGSIIKQRQSLVCEEFEEVPQWLETFWEDADNLKQQYRAGDIVYAGRSRTLGERTKLDSSSGSALPERVAYRDIYDQFLPDEWKRDQVGAGNRPEGLSQPTGDTQDDDIDELFGSDPEDDLDAPVVKQDSQTPQPDRISVPSRRPRSPSSDDTDALAPPAKRSVFERRAHRRRREEALGHRHLLASERLLAETTPEIEQQTPQPEASPLPIGIKARLGLNWSTVPLPPSLLTPRSNSVLTTTSAAPSEGFRRRTALLTHDSESGELIERRWIRVRSSTAGESTNGSTAVGTGSSTAVLSPVQERGYLAAAGACADSPQTAVMWDSEAGDGHPNRGGSAQSPVASTTVPAPQSVPASTPQVEDYLFSFEELPDFEELADFEELVDFEDVEPAIANDPTPETEAANRALFDSSREVSESLADPMGPQEARRWKLLDKPTVPDAPIGYTGIITGIKR